VNGARLAGKVALVTGAARGIGLACVEEMVRHGAQVGIADIDAAGARQATAAIGPAALALGLDVTAAKDWQAGVAGLEAHFGRLNVLVNNAGICLRGNVEDLAEADWDRTMDVDLKSVYLGCKYALPALARHAPAAIVNISSIAAMVAGHNFAAYNAAKAGVLMLTKSVALDAARRALGVRANSVHPAFIDTAMVDAVVGGGDPAAARAKLARQVPLGRIGTPRDVALAVVYLASDESSFMTGAELKLDGGLSAM
jgi:NAD(P)-dependent dehydrogenase (short-subunit alcohol dehydrogenase family)